MLDAVDCANAGGSCVVSLLEDGARSLRAAEFLGSADRVRKACSFACERAPARRQLHIVRHMLSLSSILTGFSRMALQFLTLNPMRKLRKSWHFRRLIIQ